MFRVTQSPQFWSTIEAEVVPEEGGKRRKFEFDVYLPRMDSDELKKFGESIRKGTMEDNDVARHLLLGTWRSVVYPVSEEKPGNEEKAKPLVGKWRKVCDEKDQPLNLSDGNVDALLSNVGIGSLISRKFFADIGRAGEKI